MSSIDTWIGNDWSQTNTSLEWVELIPEHCERAYALSWSGDRPWSLYQQAFALFGFATWLHQRAPEIDGPIESLLSAISVSELSSGLWVGGTVIVSVGDFQVCLLPGPSLSDDQVAVPSEVLESFQNGCHFYVWVVVNLELEQVAVRSFQHYGTLRQACASINPGPDGTYWIDEEYFEPNPDQLLLQLTCLAPEAIPLPVVNGIEAPETASLVPASSAPSSIDQATVIPLETSAEPQTAWGSQLSSWVQGTIDTSWQTVEALFGSTPLHYEWRVSSDAAVAPIVRGKVIEALPLPSDKPIVLLVEVLPAADPSATDLSITLKVSSADGQQFLPASLELMVLDEVGESVMQVQARDENRMLELGFYAARGDRFSVRLNLHDTIVDEYFTV
ncbi:MAG: DUF1822 family protein [Cyanobacteria bacterium P01_F01_bin.150]